MQNIKKEIPNTTRRFILQYDKKMIDGVEVNSLSLVRIPLHKEKKLNSQGVLK